MSEELNRVHEAYRRLQAEILDGEHKLEQARLLVEKLQSKVDKLNSDRLVWQDVIRIIEGTTSKESEVEIRREASVPDGRRGPRGPWRALVPALADKFTDVFGYSDVQSVAHAMTLTVQKHTLRAQMANYVNAGWLERVRNGKFKFTDKGRREFENGSNEKADQSSEEEFSEHDGAQ